MYKHEHNFKWRKKDGLVVGEPALAVRVNQALPQTLCYLKQVVSGRYPSRCSGTWPSCRYWPPSAVGGAGLGTRDLGAGAAQERRCRGWVCWQQRAKGFVCPLPSGAGPQGCGTPCLLRAVLAAPLPSGVSEREYGHLGEAPYVQKHPLHGAVGGGAEHWLNHCQRPWDQVAERCLKISFLPLLLLPLDEGPYKQKWQK